jgi:hypothetical protein
VVRCVDHKTGGLVALKIIRNKKRFHQQALVEVNILQKLREWVKQKLLLGPTVSQALTYLFTGSQEQAQHGQLHSQLLLPRPSLHLDGAS